MAKKSLPYLSMRHRLVSRRHSKIVNHGLLSREKREVQEVDEVVTEKMLSLVYLHREASGRRR